MLEKLRGGIIVFGLGKSRTKFGKWIDKNDLVQEEISRVSKVGNTTISNMCKNNEYRPKYSTWTKVEKGLQKLGFKKEYGDFWDM